VKIVLDTNVLMSGIFFGGIPGEILDAWKERRISIALSPSIIAEYRRVDEDLEQRYGDLGLTSLLALMISHSEDVDVGPVAEGVSSDPDDDKFLACAAAAGAPIVVSGDDDLLSVGAWNDVEVVSPRGFRDSYLSGEGRSEIC
jgi:putative PIN family toxin of toxin-antitoxin system